MDILEELRVAGELTQDCANAHSKRKELCNVLHERANWPIGILLGDGRPSMHDITAKHFPLHHLYLVALSNEVNNKKFQAESILSRIANRYPTEDGEFQAKYSQERFFDLMMEMGNTLNNVVSEWQHMGRVWNGH